MAEDKNFVLTFLKISESFYSLFIGIIKWRGQAYPVSSLLLRIFGVMGFLYFIFYGHNTISREDTFSMILQTLMRLNLSLVVLWTYFAELYHNSRAASTADDLWKITKGLEKLGIRLPRLKLIFYQIAEFLFFVTNIYNSIQLLNSRSPFWFLECILSVWTTTIIMICGTSFTKYVYVILLQFKEVNASCRRLENSAYSVSQQILVILNIREQHMAITNATRKILSFYQHYFFLYCTWSAVGIIYSVVIIYMQLATQNYQFNITLLASSKILSIVGQILLVLNVCTMAATEGNYTSLMVYDMTSDKHNLGLRLEVYSFFEYLERQKIKFKVHGTIVLNNSSLLCLYIVAISYWRIMHVASARRLPPNNASQMDACQGEEPVVPLRLSKDVRPASNFIII